MRVMTSPGGFRFLPTDGPFSAGVAAEPGYQIVRVHPPRYTPLEEGFHVVEQALAAAGRPLNALCAIELRIPKPLTRDGFDRFNDGYVEQLEKWGLRVNEQIPGARTNVAPEMEPPSGPCLHAFCHTIEGQERPTFVISGMGTRDKVPGFWATIIQTLEERMNALGVGWADVGEAQFYGTRADHEVFHDDNLYRFAELVRPGLRWYFSRPPVDFGRLEIDLRAIARDTSM
jgi:hypothetical protein